MRSVRDFQLPSLPIEPLGGLVPNNVQFLACGADSPYLVFVSLNVSPLISTMWRVPPYQPVQAWWTYLAWIVWISWWIFVLNCPKKSQKNKFQNFVFLEMIRLSRRFLTQHKKYGAAFLPIEDWYQKQFEEILDHYAKRSGWGTFR